LISPHPAFVFGCNSTSTSLNIAKVSHYSLMIQKI
jgi:hypothetical protein